MSTLEDNLKIIISAQDEASSVLHNVGVAAGAMAVAAAGAMIAMAETTANAGEEVRKLARETGLGAEAASALRFAGERLNINTETLSKSFGIFSKNVDLHADAMKKLGVEVAHNADGSVDFGGTIALLADQFAQMPVGVEKTSLALQIFGRGGKDMIQLLDQGSAGLSEMRDEAQKMGGIFSGEGTESTHAFVLAQKDLQERFVGVRNAIGLAVIPTLTTLMTIFGEVFDVLTGRAPDAGAALTGALGPDMAKTIMGAIAGIRNAIMFLKDHMDIAGPAIAAVAVAMGAMIVIALAPILIPLAAIGLAVAGLAFVWKNNLGDIQGKVQAVFGFIGGVFEIFKTDGLLGLLKAAGEFALKMLSAFADVGKNIVKGLLDGLGGMKDALLDAIRKAFEAIDFWVGPFHIIGGRIEINLPSIGGGGGGGMNPNPTAPVDVGHAAAGGIFTRPTLSWIGEAGPEAVIPLSRMGGMGTINNYITVSGNITESEQALAEKVGDAILRNLQHQHQMSY